MPPTRIGVIPVRRCLAPVPSGGARPETLPAGTGSRRRAAGVLVLRHHVLQQRDQPAGLALGQRPDQPALGAHVANCGYMVAESARGRGVGAQMCQHSQDEARRLGYRAMQYNLVVKTNEPSVHLWQKMGFEIVGTLPGAFRHAEHGFIDAYIMYKDLPDEES